MARLGIYIDRILTTLPTPPNTFYKANKDITKIIIMYGGRQQQPWSNKASAINVRWVIEFLSQINVQTDMLVEIVI